jgi:hypothetical protein
MIDPTRVCFYTPTGLSKPKSELFGRVARHIQVLGGTVIPTGNIEALRLHANRGQVPIVGCMPETRPLIDEWRAANRPWIYWDRGYARRIYATWLPRAEKDTGYYRWHFGGFQLQKMRDVPDDRWKALRIEAEVAPATGLATSSSRRRPGHTLASTTPRVGSPTRLIPSQGSRVGSSLSETKRASAICGRISKAPMLWLRTAASRRLRLW